MTTPGGLAFVSLCVRSRYRAEQLAIAEQNLVIRRSRADCVEVLSELSTKEATMAFLDGALALDRGSPVAVTEAASVSAEPNPVAGTGDDISSTSGARVVATIVLAVGVVLALVLNEKDVAFQPREGFALFTGFYIAAQAIERVLELVPAGLGSKQAKANRAVIFPAFGFILAVLLAEQLGLFYVQAVGVADLSKDWDVIITALAIAGGTKPLHDGIKRIEKAKETPPTTT